jgi:beta-glucanase (GH16 family)
MLKLKDIMSGIPQFKRFIRHPSSSIKALLLIAGFAAVGYIGFQISHAATYAVAIEAESGTQSVNAKVNDDNGASNGKSVKFMPASSGGGDNATAGCQPTPKANGGTWQCTFSDEFDGSKPLSSSWELYGQGKWGGLGQACLVMDDSHTKVENGSLHLTATPGGSGCNWTGGGIQTHGKFYQQFGRFEIRAKLPGDNSSWPAIWMLPNDNNEGEIDILEALGGDNENVGGQLLPGNKHFAFSLHQPAGGPGPTTRCAVTPDINSDFHTYTFEWSATNMVLLVDGKQCLDFKGYGNGGSNPPGFPSIFTSTPYHLILNLAVAPGGWGLPAPGNTPMNMYVDYVRAWK